MTGAGTQSLERAVWEFVRQFAFADLDDGSVASIRRLLKDQLGVQVGCSVLPWARSVDAFARSEGAPGKSSVVASGRRTNAPNAAFVNATYGHSFEYDDVHRASGSHPGCCVVATGLAVGEAEDATVEDVFTAIATGYEVYTRIGTLGTPHLLNRGWHPHAVLSVFGAAATTAKLLDLDPDEIHHALAIAASHASGTTEYTSTGGSVKRVHAGIGTKNGIQSAKLARQGITGPDRYLTGNKGIFRTFLETDVDSTAAFERDGPLEIDELWLKPHSCCGCTHAYLDAVERIDPRPGEIDTVRARIQPQSDSIIGTRNENAFRPGNIEEAQFSLPFQIALAVRGHGNGFETHRRIVDGELLDDEGVRETLARVELDVDESLDREYPSKYVGEVEVTYRSGESERVFVENPRGTPENPLAEAEIREKFASLTEPILGADRSESLWNELDRIEPLAPITRITELTRPAE